MVDRGIADMLEERNRQSYLLRTGRRTYDGPAFREDGACRQTGVHNGHRTGSALSQSLDDAKREE